jgi:hypothetical protein
MSHRPRWAVAGWAAWAAWTCKSRLICRLIEGRACRGLFNMFDEHRQFNTCAFCESTDLTKEHVFGKSVAKLLPTKYHWEAYSQDSLLGTAERRKGSGPLLNVAPRMVCEEQNNNLLSSELKSSLDLLAKLIFGTSKNIPSTAKRSLRRYLERIALLEDLHSSNQDITEKYKLTTEYKRSAQFRTNPPLISKNDRVNWSRGESLSQLDIFVGHHPRYLGLNPPATSTLSEDGKSKKFVFVIKHFAVITSIGSTHESPIPNSFRHLSSIDESDVLLGNVSYDDHFAALKQTDLTKAMRLLLRDTKVLRELEIAARKNGEFKVVGKHFEQLRHLEFLHSRGFLS